MSSFMRSSFFLDNNVASLSQLAQVRGMGPEVLRRMLDNVHFIADHFRAKQKRDKVGALGGINSTQHKICLGVRELVVCGIRS